MTIFTQAKIITPSSKICKNKKKIWNSQPDSTGLRELFGKKKEKKKYSYINSRAR